MLNNDSTNFAFIYKVDNKDNPSASQSEKKWSVLDASDVSDFHKHVPDMAFKVLV